jgi:hypothetical protein
VERQAAIHGRKRNFGEKCANFTTDLPPNSFCGAEVSCGREKNQQNSGHCLVNWPTTCAPRDLGGLAILDLECFTPALRLRWLWIRWKHVNKPWVGTSGHFFTEDQKSNQTEPNCQFFGSVLFFVLANIGYQCRLWFSFPTEPI